MSELRKIIIPLVDELRSLDRRFRVFGSEQRWIRWFRWSTGHGYRFNKTIPLRDVVAFEQEQSIQLPDDYREFIVDIGNGGAGPHYGLESLAAGSNGMSLASPFPWFEQTTISDEELMFWRTGPGVLYLADRGCGGADILVVNGPARGQVWSDFSNIDGTLNPISASFTDWYLAWVERCIATIKREPLIDKIRIGMTVDEARDILGPLINTWGYDGDSPERSKSYMVAFKDINATFQVRQDQRILTIHKMPFV